MLQTSQSNAMAVPLRMISNKRGVLARLKSLINSQLLQSRSFDSSVPKGPAQDQLSAAETGFDYSACRDRFDISKWKALDARELGITSSMVSRSSWFVLKSLQSKGFKSYLVGGCVRDLLLNRTPKDFDVITTAKLMQLRKQLRHLARAEVVGRRFPVCLVHIKGSVVEVTSFETVTQTSQATEQFLNSLLPKCSNKEDLFRCKNSLHRDFTINSLFYDPFDNKIYDYTNGMADLRSLKLETVIPAQLSFKEDPGRILRGFRIAARLGLSLSRETEAAIWTYASLVKDLNKQKIMIELNYMLSYGAAEPSLRLLWKFKLLEFLLPVHAAYLDEQATKEDAQASTMLMKLFFHLDNLVGCDRPSDCSLWVGLLAFHLALVKNSQDALVVWTLASVLYHGDWEGGVKFAKEHAKMCVNFAPEIRRSSIYKSDEEIAKAVTKLAYSAIDSIPALVEDSSLLKSLSRYPSFPRSGIVFIPRKTGRTVSEIFRMLVNDIELYKSERKSSKINYDKLGRGDLSETAFVLGKIILETMNSGIVGDRVDYKGEKCHLKTEGTKEIGQLKLSDPFVARKNKRQVLSTSNPEQRQEKIKKQRLVENGWDAEQKMGSGNQELFEKFEYKKTNEEHQMPVKLRKKIDLSTMKHSPPKKNSHRKQRINDRRKIASAGKNSLYQASHLKMNEHDKCTSSQSTVSKNHQVIPNNCNINVDVKATDESDL